MQLLGLTFATDLLFVRRDSRWEQVHASERIQVRQPGLTVVYLSHPDAIPRDAELAVTDDDDDDLVFTAPLIEAYTPANLVRQGLVMIAAGEQWGAGTDLSAALALAMN